MAFPEWYTEDMWDVDFIWGNYNTLPIYYNEMDGNRRSTLLGVGSDVLYELRVGFPDREPIAINLWELKEHLVSLNKFLPPDYWQEENGYYESADEEAITRMENSGTWGDYILRLLPDMSPEAVETVVAIYLDRHLFSGITPPEAARQVADTVAPALEYMNGGARDTAEKRIAAYY